MQIGPGLDKMVRLLEEQNRLLARQNELLEIIESSCASTAASLRNMDRVPAR